MPNSINCFMFSLKELLNEDLDDRAIEGQCYQFLKKNQKCFKIKIGIESEVFQVSSAGQPIWKAKHIYSNRSKHHNIHIHILFWHIATVKPA